MRSTLTFTLGGAALAAMLAACGGTPATPPSGPTAGVTVTMAFPSPAGRFAPLAVPGGVDSAVVTVFDLTDNKPVTFDATGAVSRLDVAVKLTGQASQKTLSLPLGLNYRVCISARNSVKDVEDAFGCADTGTLAADKTVSPVLASIVDHAALELAPAPVTGGFYYAGKTYPVFLRVYAPDGTLVPSGDYTAGEYSLNTANVDATSGGASLRGQLVKLGLIDGTTVSATVTGMNASHETGTEFAAVSDPMNLATAGGSIVEDLAAPVIQSVTVSGADLIVTLPDGPQGVTNWLAYRDGIAEIALPEPTVVGNVYTFANAVNPALDAGDFVTVFAQDASGNESDAVDYPAAPN